MIPDQNIITEKLMKKNMIISCIVLSITTGSVLILSLWPDKTKEAQAQPAGCITFRLTSCVGCVGLGNSNCPAPTTTLISQVTSTLTPTTYRVGLCASP